MGRVGRGIANSTRRLRTVRILDAARRAEQTSTARRAVDQKTGRYARATKAYLYSNCHTDNTDTPFLHGHVVVRSGPKTTLRSRRSNLIMGSYVRFKHYYLTTLEAERCPEQRVRTTSTHLSRVPTALTGLLAHCAHRLAAPCSSCPIAKQILPRQKRKIFYLREKYICALKLSARRVPRSLPARMRYATCPGSKDLSVRQLLHG